MEKQGQLWPKIYKKKKVNLYKWNLAKYQTLKIKNNLNKRINNAEKNYYV